jgi:hypothetical protein
MTEAALPIAAEASERAVFAILAAQLAALRDRMAAGSAVEILWRTTDILSDLSGRIGELLRQCPAPELGLREKCGAGVAAAAEIGHELDGLACLQAQRQDLDRQMVDCVATALEHLAVDPGPMGTRMSPGDLAALYVSEDQRHVHEAVMRRLGIEAPLGSSQASTHSRIREGSGK